MDEYNATIAREVLSKAEAELIKAENYLVKAEAPGYILRNARTVINRTRILQDRIINAMKYKVDN